MNNTLKLTIQITALLAVLLPGTHAFARDDQKMHPIEEALNSAAAKEKLDPAIKLYFGSQPTPATAQNFGEWKTNKKTNGFNKSDRAACEWTFLSALLELQERARKEGGNAIINIKSNYKNQETSSETEYMCGSGALMSGVALKGDVVKLK